MRLLLYGSIATLMIVGLYMAQTGNIPEFEKCKESIFTQVISGECTLRDGYKDRTIILKEEGKDI